MTRFLLGNTIHIAYFIFTKLLNTPNVALQTERDSSKCSQKTTHITKASLKSVNFIFFLWANLIFVIFLCQRVKPVLAILVAMVTLMWSFNELLVFLYVK